MLRLAAYPIVFVLLSFAASRPARGAERPRVVVTAPTANLRAEPSSAASVVAQVPKGTVLEVLEERGPWLEVLYRHPELGLVQGYVAARLVGPVATGGEAPPAAPAREAPSGRYWEFRVLAGLNPGVADGYDQTVADRLPVYFEPVPLDGRYRAKPAPVLGLGVEYHPNHRLGVGLEGNFMPGRTSADLTAQVPHPLYFGIRRETRANGIGDFAYRKFGGTLYIAYRPSGPTASPGFSLTAGIALHVMQFESLTGLEIRESAYPYDDPPTVTGVTQASKSALLFGGVVGLGLYLRPARSITLDVEPRVLFETGAPTGPLGEKVKPKPLGLWVVVALRFRP